MPNFSMPLCRNGLGAYTQMLYRVDWERLRKTFRTERTSRVGSRAKLVGKIGEDDEIDESTVYRLEQEADYFPKLNTLARLVEAMGLTLVEFFARVEGVTAPGGLEVSDFQPDSDTAKLAAALDRLVAVHSARQPAESTEGATLTIRLQKPLDAGQRQSVEEYAKRLARGQVDAPAASESPRRPATTGRRRKQV
jgi:transcriptional regulator with XRE-family HTH domain